jgi:hypothetical protein
VSVVCCQVEVSATGRSLGRVVLPNAVCLSSRNLGNEGA